MDNKISVLVVGCDKHKNLLDRFFKSFYQFVDPSDVDVYISLERIAYSYGSENITVFNEPDSRLNWCGRVKNCVRQIPAKSILLMLDDFIIESPVDMDMIRRLANEIAAHDEIAHFALTTVPMKNASSQKFYDHFYLRAQYGRYKTTLQCGIWNRDELIDLLNDKESPWQYEIFGNIRSYLSARKYYALDDKANKPIEYNDGWFALQGKLNEVEVKRLEDKLGESFHVEGMVSNEGIVVRNATPFYRRITGRLKIIVYTVKYRAICLWRKVHE